MLSFEIDQRLILQQTLRKAKADRYEMLVYMWSLATLRKIQWSVQITQGNGRIAHPTKSLLNIELSVVWVDWDITPIKQNLAINKNIYFIFIWYLMMSSLSLVSLYIYASEIWFVSTTYLSSLWMSTVLWNMLF